MARKANIARVTASDRPRIRIPAGARASVTFHRDGGGRTRDLVVFPGLGRLVTLPEDADVVVEFPPLLPGEYEFCFTDGAPCGTLVVAERHDGR